MSTFAASGKRLFPSAGALSDGAGVSADAPSEAKAAPALDMASFEGVGFEDEVTDEELLDFLAADLDPVPADPVFQEKLGDELWEMVAAGRVGRRSDH